MKLSINILCWNTLRTLKQALEVIEQELEDIGHEIVVVDNGSTDGTKQYLQAIAVGSNGIIKPIIKEKNEGISYGKNAGIEASKGDYIMLLDGDIIPIPGSIIKFMEFLDKTKEADAIGFYSNKYSNQINRNGQIHHEERCDRLFEPRPHSSHCIYYGLYRREVFDKVRFCTDGAFGEPGYGWEDFDFHSQMVRAGFSQWVAHINNAKGKYFHDINSSIRMMGRQKFRESSVARRAVFHEREKLADARQTNSCSLG